MKREYRKPEIMFEDFTLSTNIAGDCEKKTNTPSKMQCAYTVTDEFGDVSNLFLSGIAACDTPQASGQYDGFCYDIPIEAYTLFNS